MKDVKKLGSKGNAHLFATKTFCVDAGSEWYLVNAKDIKQVKRDARKEYLLVLIKNIRIATKDEIKYYLSIKTSIGEAE